MDTAIEQRKASEGSHEESIDLSAGFVSKQSSHELPESGKPAPSRGTAHVDDIAEPELEEIAQRPTPQEGWTVIAEEDIVQSHPHLAAETVLLVSVLADTSLLDVLSALEDDCFYLVSHQAIFTGHARLRQCLRSVCWPPLRNIHAHATSQTIGFRSAHPSALLWVLSEKPCSLS